MDQTRPEGSSTTSQGTSDIGTRIPPKMAFSSAFRRSIVLSRSVPRLNFSQTIPFSRKTKPVKDTSNQWDFDSEASKILADIETAMRPLQSMNNKFDIIVHPGELQIDTGVKGWFVFRVNTLNQHLLVTTPVSGTFLYQFDPESRQWLNDRDGHDMRGLVTRDILRAYVGCPNFT